MSLKNFPFCNSVVVAEGEQLRGHKPDCYLVSYTSWEKWTKRPGEDMIIEKLDKAKQLLTDCMNADIMPDYRYAAIKKLLEKE